MGWEDELDAVWRTAAEDPETLVARIERVVSAPEGPAAIREFEIGGAYDSSGRPDEAVARYRRAVAAGLDDHRARQATIQLASSLRRRYPPRRAAPHPVHAGATHARRAERTPRR